MDVLDVRSKNETARETGLIALRVAPRTNHDPLHPVLARRSYPRRIEFDSRCHAGPQFQNCQLVSELLGGLLSCDYRLRCWPLEDESMGVYSLRTCRRSKSDHYGSCW